LKTDIKIDEIIRSKRKTVSIQIKDDGRLIVRAPLRLSKKNILSIVKKHQNWIDTKQQEIIQRNKTLKKFSEGEEFLYLGKYYPLKIVNNNENLLTFEDNFYLSDYCLSNAKEVFTNWYKQNAEKIIKYRAEYYADIYNLKYTKIKISNAKTRWGSCSYNGNININWRLIMAPVEVLDYVIVHELVHLKIDNHSKNFWQNVEMIYPDYKKAKKWLKDNAHLLLQF
jgi:predicted metal-dependent hydrolase